MNYKNIQVDEAGELLNHADTVVLDVRSSAELSEGSIPGYIMRDFFSPNFKLEVDKLDKSKTYLVYCRSGNRSAQACGIMDSMGFTNLYNLTGGIGAWNLANVGS